MRVLSLIPAAAALVPSQQPKAPVAQRAATLEAAPVATEARALTGNIPDCPATIWDADGVDIAKERESLKALGACPIELKAAAAADELAAHAPPLLLQTGTAGLADVSIAVGEYARDDVTHDAVQALLGEPLPQRAQQLTVHVDGARVLAGGGHEVCQGRFACPGTLCKRGDLRGELAGVSGGMHQQLG